MTGREHGPSEKAVEAAARLAAAPRCSNWGDGLTAARVSALLAAAHDPALGLDRSVCLRDVIAIVRPEPIGGTPLAAVDFDRAETQARIADQLERRLTESSSPDREGAE